MTETATVARIRLMLGEHTALALGVLVAADVLDTVLKPAHAYQLGKLVMFKKIGLERKWNDKMGGAKWENRRYVIGLKRREEKRRDEKINKFEIVS